MNIIESLINADNPGILLKNIPKLELKLNFPELYMCSLVLQKHNQTILDHTSKVLGCVRDKNKITICSALFHDIGKIHTRKRINDKITFHDHPNSSSIIAKKYLKKWLYDDKIIDSVCRIIETHMFDIHREFSDKNIRNFIAKVGINNIKNWFILRKADAMSYKNIKDNDILSSEDYVYKYIDSFEKIINDNIIELNKSNSINFDQTGEFHVFGKNS